MKSPIAKYRADNKLSLERFGSMFGVMKTTVRYWEQKGVPPERCAEIEKATGIPKKKLRPDIFEDA